MRKTELVKSFAEITGVSQRIALECVDTVLETIIEGVKADGKVSIHGFGKFYASKRKAREGVNPQDPSKKIKIPAMKVVVFKAGKDFKDAIK